MLSIRLQNVLENNNIFFRIIESKQIIHKNIKTWNKMLHLRMNNSEVSVYRILEKITAASKKITMNKKIALLIE